nr:hypothetical protein [Tanacetum cinerariifolium]
MAHQQLVSDVHPYEMCPPNKRYDLMDANKKIDLEHVQCPPKSKILTNIIKNHPLRFSIAASSSIPWIYMAQFWHTLKEDGSKAAIGRNSLFSSSFYIFDSLSKIHEDYHWTPSSPRSPTPKVDVAESSMTTRSTMIRLRLPQQKSTRLTPPAPVLTVDKADELILQDTLQEIEKMVEGQEHVVDDSSIPRNDEHNIPDTRLEPRSDKERPEVGITDVIVLVNVYDEEEEEDEITDDVYELNERRREECRGELQGCCRYLFEHLRAKFMPRKSFVKLPDHIHKAMADSLPTMVDKHIKEQVEKQVLEQVRNQVPIYVAEGLILGRQKTKEEMEKMIAKAILQERENIKAQISSQIQQAIANDIPSLVDTSIRIYLSGHILHVHPAQPQTTSVPEQQYRLTPAICLRDQDDPYDDAHPDGDNSAKRQKYEAYVSEESSSGQDNKQEQAPLPSGNQEQADNYDFWTDSYALNDDEIPTKQVSQDIIKERDPEAPALSLINQDLLYLKKGNSGPEKIVLSLHKFQAVVFNDDDIEEINSRWVNKYVKKFNSYARYGVEHWKNPHAKIFYIRKQKELGKPKEVIYSNSEIVQVIKTYRELGHQHKFISEIIARRANDCVVSIIEPDFKNLNKNDIEDMYLLIMNGKVPDYAKIRLLWSLSVFIKSSVIWERVHDFQHGIKSYQQKVQTLETALQGTMSENQQPRTHLAESESRENKDKKSGMPLEWTRCLVMARFRVKQGQRICLSCNGETQKVNGKNSNVSQLKVISCIKAMKSGLPPPRQVEFRIKHVPGAAPIVISEMKELAAQLQELSEKGFICPNSLPWGARKFYSKPANNNLRTSSTSQSANKKQEFVKSDYKKVVKKDDEKKRDMSRVKCYNCKKDRHFAKDCKKVKVKDYEYYKTKMLPVKKDKDEQVLLAEDQAWMESSSDSNQEINANMVFMAQIEKVLSDSEASSSSADEKISEVSYYLSKSKSESEFETSEYYDNSTDYGLFVNNDDDQEIFHDAIEYASENFIENHIDSQKDYDKSDVDHNDSEEKDHLVDKLIRKFNKKIVKCLKRIEKANQQSKDFENQNKDLQDKYDVLKSQATIFEMNNKELNELNFLN